MDLKVLIVLMLFGFGLISCSDAHHQKYHYVDHPMTWTEAQRYCRQFYYDLATFESMEDLDLLNRPSSMTSAVWIGLWDDPKSWKATLSHDPNSWRWSATGSTSTTGYHNMDAGFIDFYRGVQTCVAIMGNGKWDDSSCGTTSVFVCYNAINDQKQYVLIEQKSKWKDAQLYCRANHTDLAVIENDQENKNVRSLINGQKAWIGLYREPWMWSDGSRSSFRKWRASQPGNSGGSEHCVAQNLDHTWDDHACHVTFPFLCQEAPTEKQRIAVRLTIRTSANLSDPATHVQLLQQMETLESLTGLNLVWRLRPRV